MARRRYVFDEKKRQRFLKEGRGTGHGSDYKPWLTIQDVSSLGRSTRIFSFKTGREHHLLSDLETGLFLLVEWSERVRDIREQFPLDRDVTRMLAEKMGIVHPRDTHTQTDIIMTTDMVVDVLFEGAIHTIAFSVKPASKLDDPRTLEKLELERRYWARDQIAWYLVTEKDLPEIRIGNLRWLHEMQSIENLKAPYEGYWTDRVGRFLNEFSRVHGGLIEDFLRHLQKNCGFSAGEGMIVLRHLAANKKIEIDLDREFSAKNACDVLTVVGQGVLDRRTA